MFAAKNHERSKTKAEKPSVQVNAKGETAERVQVNPVWNQLATRVQAKLTVGAPDDPYEREADRVADQVMRIPDPVVQRACPTCAAGGAPCAKCREKNGAAIHRKAGGSGDIAGASVPAGFLSNLGSGRPLDTPTRGFMEPRFGQSFQGVRLHDDDMADAAAQSVKARAFTLGRDIVFARGEYAPGSEAGRKLLAHELTHAVQQGSSMGSASFQQAAVGPSPARIAPRAVPALQRSPISDEVDKVFKDTASANAVLGVLARPSTQTQKTDADLQASLAKIFTSAGDLAVAQQILEGELGKTAGTYAGAPASLKKTPRRVEALFFRGTSEKRALVIAGVHGTEKQGVEVAEMLRKDLAATAPFYNVIMVPTLFPDQGAAGRREGTVETNRNFPATGAKLAQAKTSKAGEPIDADGEKILAENVMLIHLVERFQPERIISIHGTQHEQRAGVFSDPVGITDAEWRMIHAAAKEEATSVYPMMLRRRGPWGRDEDTASDTWWIAQQLAAAYRQYKTEMDQKSALAAARAIAAKTSADKELATRPATMKARWDALKAAGKDVPSAKTQEEALAAVAANPSVAGDRLDLTGKENPTWPGEVKGGVSLGGWAPSLGISVFTVEPPVNVTSASYPSKTDKDVSEATRKMELQAYADAVRTVLLG